MFKLNFYFGYIFIVSLASTLMCISQIFRRHGLMFCRGVSYEHVHYITSLNIALVAKSVQAFFFPYLVK